MITLQQHRQANGHRRFVVSISGIAILALVMVACVPVTPVSPPAQTPAVQVPEPTKVGANELLPLHSCLDFDELTLGTTYQVPATFGTTEATMAVLPFQWDNGTWTSAGDGASVHNAADAGGSGNELFLNNVNLGYDVGSLQCVSIRYHDMGGNVNLVINNVVGNYSDFVDTNLGGVEVLVANDSSGNNSGSLTLSGKFESFPFQEQQLISFAIGGQELAIDNLCPCESATPTQQVLPISREAAAQVVLETSPPEMLTQFDPSRGLRINQYQDLFPAGSEVRPASPDAGHDQAVTCQNACWLTMIDKDPLAHFAHPVEIVTVDSVTGEMKRIEAEWWPEVNGLPVFDTLSNRADSKQIILYQAPFPSQTPSHDLPPAMNVIVQGACSETNACHTWAVIVCGFDDLPDTFDEDTDGMYTVLQGLGVPDDHIFFVSPHTTHPGVDQATSIANVEWAIDQVAQQSGPTDRVLFFYSSHGGIDSLSCVPGSPGGGSISAAQLSGWLDDITSANLSVVIEACDSGSLIGRYSDGSYVASEDNLTGHGESNRVVFTSASSDTSSYGDLDGPGDPNPADAGSETIWGYVEAYVTASADTNHDANMPVGEAFQYAWDDDFSRIQGLNTPQFTSTGLVAAATYDYCRCSLPGNLLQNPDAGLDIQYWTAYGNASIDTSSGDPAFAVRDHGHFFQDVPIPSDAIGKFALLIGRVSSERINANGSITGLPYLYGYMMDGNQIYAYLQGQNMLSNAATVNQWVAAWGIFPIVSGTTNLRFFLNQAERAGDPQNGSAARFDDLGLYIAADEASANQLAARYRQLFVP